MESTRGCGTSQNKFNLAPLPRGLRLVSGLPAPTNDYPVSLHPGLSARTCMAQPNRSLEAAGETFFKRFPARAPSPATKTARYGHDDGHQPPPVHDRLAQHSGGGGLKSITCVFGAGKNGGDFFGLPHTTPVRPLPITGIQPPRRRAVKKQFYSRITESFDPTDVGSLDARHKGEHDGELGCTGFPLSGHRIVNDNQTL
jgi:hypothetical protein